MLQIWKMKQNFFLKRFILVQAKKTARGRKKASQGDNYFVADNPPFGVEFTYFLKEKYSSKKSKRKKEERKLEKKI